ncbi:MAG: cation transporter [Planctomycetota bacterium]
MACDDCHDTKDLAHAAPAYRRALVIVVALNLGMGVLEMAGGLVGLSQALKADALDFLGDGLITLLGLLAISRSHRWRARAALLQGVFLGLLGIGVIGAAVYRALEYRLPEAAVMGVLGFLALATNIAAAFILAKHRRGDANVMAVWLFSRNDAVGNAAVIIAGTLVYWTGSVWPDLVAAVVIAILFLWGAWQIVEAARHELRGLRRATEPSVK